MATSTLPIPLTGSCLNQTMFRIKDPEVSIPFYTKHFQMTLLRKRVFSDFSLYFLATLPEGHAVPTTEEEEQAYLNSGAYGSVLELTYNHGTEKEEGPVYISGNEPEYKGFGHIGFLVDDVYAFSAELEAAGVEFQKKPDDGNMKGLAFAKDPDGYWIEIIKRSEGAAVKGRPTFQQTMLRVKDYKVSTKYYEENFNMTVIDFLDFPQWKFNLTFMANITEEEKAALPGDVGSDERHKYLWSVPYTTIELTYNYGTDTDPEFKGYYNGNGGKNNEKRGFGHIAFMVDDVYKTCEEMQARNLPFHKLPDEGRMKGLAFALDPDGYWIEIIRRAPKA